MNKQDTQSIQDKAAKYVKADGFIFGRMNTIPLIKLANIPNIPIIGMTTQYNRNVTRFGGILEYVSVPFVSTVTLPTKGFLVVKEPSRSSIFSTRLFHVILLQSILIDKQKLTELTYFPINILMKMRSTLSGFQCRAALRISSLHIIQRPTIKSRKLFSTADCLYSHINLFNLHHSLNKLIVYRFY